MSKKLSARFWCALSVFSLIGQVAWVVENMYFNVFIYNMFNASATDISAMVAASAVAATLTTVFIGALSDRVGKRKIFIVGGYILWGISIFAFSFVRVDVLGNILPMTVSAASLGIGITITLDCVMTFFGSSANDAAFNAWLTDSTDSSNRGAAEGINAMMPLVAILVVFGGFMFFDLKLADSWSMIFGIIGAVVIVSGILGVFLIDDADIRPSESGYLSNIIYGFKPSSIKRYPEIYVALAAFAVFSISIQVFMPYLIIYYEKSLCMTDYVLIMAPAIIVAAVFTALWGKVYDKKGVKLSLSLSLVMLCSGYVILYLYKAKMPVFLGSLLMMCGYLASAAVFGAVVRDSTPKGMAGRYQGLRIFFAVLIPGVIGPYIGAWVLKDSDIVYNGDGTTSFLPNENIFMAALIVIAALIPLIFILFKMSKPKTEDLETDYEKDIGKIPYEEYPRPSMRRESYMSLCGKWDLCIMRGKRARYKGDITVPYPIESRISGVGMSVGASDTIIYERTFTLPRGFVRDRVIVHFGAVDQTCTVFVNGKEAGSHVGGYLPFEFDITDLLDGTENNITVKVRDPLDTELTYGKQSKRRGGMWYTPISGIWQSVWLESVCDNYIKSIKLTPFLDCVKIEVDGGEDEKSFICDGKRYTFVGDSYVFTPEKIHLWTPQKPHLYEFSLICGEDRVESYFALRTVDIRDGYIRLNEEPYFFHGLLDQGYYSDGIYLPATSEGYRDDILRMKALGFNMLRKHIKIEPELFYYYCDRYGMIVFQDIVNSGKYNFLIDTVYPTFFSKKGITHRASKRRREHFESTARETVAHLYNHPSVCYYTLFNEGWGQYDADRLYGEMKECDGSRIWDATSGWFKESASDVESEHIYFKEIKLKRSDRPLVLSEFGGYSMKVEGHSFNTRDTYGYKFFTDREKFCEALDSLYRTEVIRAIKDARLCAAVLTQVSDVEDETNGLLTYDRRVMKVNEKDMRDMSDTLFAAFYESIDK